jgi:hypothetical protein
MKIVMGILLVATMLPLSGCHFELPSVYPLYTDQTAVAEPRLVGAWQTKDGKEQMFVNLTGDRQYRLAHIDENGEALQWKLRVVILGETLVADVMAGKDDSAIPAHHFLALSFDGETLKVWFLDSSPLREKAGKEGLAAMPDKNKVVLTAPTASLAEFLKKNIAEEMKKSADMEYLPLK